MHKYVCICSIISLSLVLIYDKKTLVLNDDFYILYAHLICRVCKQNVIQATASNNWAAIIKERMNE